MWSSKCDVGASFVWGFEGLPPTLPAETNFGFLKPRPNPPPPPNNVEGAIGPGSKFFFSGNREDRFGTQHCLGGGRGGAAESEVKF